jgi:hypothetical protein
LELVCFWAEFVLKLNESPVDGLEARYGKKKMKNKQLFALVAD